MRLNFFSKNRRSALLALTILVGLTLTLVLILSVSRPGERASVGPEAAQIATTPPSAVPDPAPPQSVPLSPTSPAESASLPQAQGTTPQNLDTTIALVNGEAITGEDFARTQAVDEAMSVLFDLPPGTGQERLERIINTLLVRQQAQAADFAVDEAEAQAVVAQLLQRYGRTEAGLNQALEARGVTYADLIGYLQGSLTADRFLAAQADGSGTTLVALQQAARISLGNGVTLLTAEPTPSSPLAPGRAATPEASPTASPTGAALATLPSPPSQETSPPATPTLLRGLAVGNLLPGFVLPLLGSGELSGQDLRADDLIGQPTVLSFFTTWCPYCRQQTPLLVEAAARYQPQGVQFIGIDVREETGIVSQYVATYGIPFPVVMDQAGEVADLYAVRGYPTTYFLDSQGRIHARHIGALREDSLAQYLENLLAENTP
jgi:thiol-disulfide isomerase/thioredoxin